MSVAEEQWILGYLSGFADSEDAAGVAGSGPLAGTDAAGVWAWIDTYCRANPSETIEIAALQFAAFGRHSFDKHPPKKGAPRTPAQR